MLVKFWHEFWYKFVKSINKWWDWLIACSTENFVDKVNRFFSRVVDEDDINLQSIEKKDSSTDEDEVSPVAKHTPSVKDRMEAMGK